MVAGRVWHEGGGALNSLARGWGALDSFAPDRGVDSASYAFVPDVETGVCSDEEHLWDVFERSRHICVVMFRLMCIRVFT